MSIEGYSNNQFNNDSNKENSMPFVVCPKCGTQNERESQYCWRCGQGLLENDVSSSQDNEVPGVGNNTMNQGSIPIKEMTDKTIFGEVKYSAKNGLSARITTKDWLKVMCLNFLIFIPFVGSLAFLIISIVLAFKDDVADSIKHYFRAQLIYGLVVTGITVIFIILLFSVFLSTINSVNNIGAYDMNTVGMALMS